MPGEPELAKQRLIQKITEAINDYFAEIEETKTITVKEIAVKLLDKNVPIADIADVTGMSTADASLLQKQTNNRKHSEDYMEHYSILDLKEILNIPFSEILEMVQSPNFPKSTIHTAGKLTWKKDEIDDYLKSRRKTKIKE